MKNDIGVLQQEIQTAIWSRGLIGNYEIVRKIGEGSFSTVFLAVHIMTRHEVVLKSADKFQLNLAAEISNMSLLSHPHIVRLYEYIVMPDKVWLVLEYCGGEELLNYLVKHKVIPPPQACRLFAQLAGAVAYAHQLHCAHRDLKLENVLLDEDGNIKLADFGFTRSYVPRTMLETVCGTESYMAPELLLHQKYNPEAADVWSLGVILYAMIYGRLPFDEDNTAETVKKIVEEDPPFPAVPKGEYLVEIARKMLCKQPSQRPRVIDMLDELREPGRQQRQLLVKISTNPESSYIFSSKEERTVLKGMKALSIDLQRTASSIVHHKCNPLHGLWYTALDRQRALNKQAAADQLNSATGLHRRKSKASIRSSKSHMSQKIPRPLIKHDHSIGDSTADSIVRSNSAAHSYHHSQGHSQGHSQQHSHHPQAQHSQGQQPAPDAESSLQLESSFSHASQSPKSSPRPDTSSVKISAPSNEELQPLPIMPTETPPIDHPLHLPRPTALAPSKEKKSRINEFIERRTTGKSRRAMEKFWAALKPKRNTGKDTLLSYYNPVTEQQRRLPAQHQHQQGQQQQGLPETPLNPHASLRRSSLSRSPSRTTSAGTPGPTSMVGTATGTATGTTVSTAGGLQPSNGGTTKMSSPILDLGRASPQSNHRLSTLSVATSASLNLGESPLRKNSSLYEENGAASSSATSLLPQTGQTSFNQLGRSVSSNSGGAGERSNMSRQISTYSQLSQVSQLSQSSIEPSQLLQEVNGGADGGAAAAAAGPGSTNTNNAHRFSASRYSSGSMWKFAGIANPPAVSTSTPPGTPLMPRSRPVRLITVKETIPSKIEEGDNESEIEHVL